MLNKFKIGTKLGVGFLFVLLLLIAQTIVSYEGLLSVQSNMQTEVNTNDILSDMAQIRNSLSIVQLDGIRRMITTDEKYKLDSDKQNEFIQQTSSKIYDSLTKDNQKNLDKLLAVHKKYTDADTRWYEIDKQQSTVVAQLQKDAEIVFNDLAKFATRVRDLMMKEKRVDNEIAYYTTTRCDQTFDIEQAVGLMQSIRRDLARLLVVDERREIEEIGQEIIKVSLPALQKCLATAKTRTAAEDQKLINDTVETLNKWLEHFNKAFEFLKEKSDIADKQNEYSKEAETTMLKILDILSEYAGTIGDKTDQTVNSILSMIIISSCVILIIGVITSYILSRNITTGLKIAMNAVNKVVLDGDLSAEITGNLILRKDEIGDLSRVASSVLSDYRGIDAMANALASGDWRITVNEKSSFDTMNQNLGKMLDQVNHALAGILDDVKEVSEGANGVSNASQTLSAGVQESSASLEQIAASMSQINGQTKANAKSAREACDLATNTTQAAMEGQKAMEKMNEAMLRITKNSEEIQRVIKVIDDIAFQTNLLALNAAVEAARAGAHGKGFAVVAEEVRNLAARSAKAAKETSELISTSGHEIEVGGDVAEHTSKVLNEIVEQVKQTADIINTIAAASDEQAQGVTQISIGLNQIDAVTQQNTATAEESASAATAMNNMASRLQESVAKFKLREESTPQPSLGG
ncbi:MAG: methyl-accepting chemotaxis protein [Planctomycetaceae bacterium]|jgi:methyl-accepting chemotaxis protein|nr:methyl-accepting chemotaxis protein [Planctomycetaceae bacterium]